MCYIIRTASCCHVLSWLHRELRSSDNIEPKLTAVAYLHTWYLPGILLAADVPWARVLFLAHQAKKKKGTNNTTTRSVYTRIQILVVSIKSVARSLLLYHTSPVEGPSRVAQGRSLQPVRIVVGLPPPCCAQQEGLPKTSSNYD